MAKKAKAKAATEPPAIELRRDDTPSVDVAAVDQLLEQSLAAHARALKLRHESALGGQDPKARNTLREAQRLRLEAHALDPAHAALGWTREQKKTPLHKDTHTEMVRFYEQQLAEE